MRNIPYILILISMLLFVNCESEEILNPDAVHIEHTVVQAEIKPGKIFPAVRFTKTLPLGVPYNIKQAELKNVTAYLLKNEVQVIPLHYTSDGLYKPLYEFYVEAYWVSDPYSHFLCFFLVFCPNIYEKLVVCDGFFAFFFFL